MFACECITIFVRAGVRLRFSTGRVCMCVCARECVR